VKGNYSEIRLSKATWLCDRAALLGEGGLGVVFAGVSLQGEPVAIKQINYTAPNVANRETLMAEFLSQSNYQHIMSILDAGVDPNTDRCYIVMPRAEYSLKAYLAEHGPLPETDALSILRQIAAGLAEVAATIVHRDLKPDNILFHDNRWKIADFGIARFVEQATASRTLKDVLTQEYAAPEQWRNEHATTATDIYALGCIAYELLGDQPPFNGPSGEDYAYQHCQTPPPPLPTGISAPLRELISLMLRKPMDSRPDLSRIIKRVDHCINLYSSPQPSQPGYHAIARIGAQLAQGEAAREALYTQQKAEQKRRAELASTATGELNQLLARFDTYLTAASVLIQISKDTGQSEYDGRLNAKLDDAILWIYRPVFTVNNANRNSSLTHSRLISPDTFPQSQWNVIAGAIIRIQKQEAEIGANFWYMTWGKHSSYRWYEVGYDGRQPYVVSNYAPIHLEDLEAIDLAAAPGISKYTMLAQPRPIDDEDTAIFCDRWAAMLALVAQGDYDATRDTYRRLISPT